MSRNYTNANEARRQRSEEMQARVLSLHASGVPREEIARMGIVGETTVRKIIAGSYQRSLRKQKTLEKAKAVPPVKVERVRVPGIVRGCPTTVYADTWEQGSALLGRMNA